MILGVGCDILEISRMESFISRGHIDRVFTENEILASSGRVSMLADDFCVKEAVSKAFGTGIVGFSLLDIEVLRDDLGKPYVKLYDGAKRIYEEKGATNLQVSISNTRELSMAYAVLES